MFAGGLFQVSYPSQALTFYLDSPFVRIPLGNQLSEMKGIPELFIACPANIQPEQVRELTIVPRNGEFYAAYWYVAKPPVAVELNTSSALSIDHGRDNWLTCVSNIGTSFIVDGLHIKSLNQWFNKRVATIKEGKPQGFWNDELAGITQKRNRQMRDAVNKAARLVIDHCLKHGIGTIVFGWNPCLKQRADMGNKGAEICITTGKRHRVLDRNSGCDNYT